MADNLCELVSNTIESINFKKYLITAHNYEMLIIPFEPNYTSGKKFFENSNQLRYFSQ